MGKLSLSTRDRSGSKSSVSSIGTSTEQDGLLQVSQSDRSKSSISLGNNMEIGEAIRVRFIWDHGGTIVYVCVMQIGIKTAPEGIMLIKNPREENLIQAAAAKAEAQSSQKIARKAKAEADVKFSKLRVSPKRNEE